MKFKKKHLFILLFCIILLFLLILSIVFAVSKNTSPIIAFYDLETNIIEAIKTSFDEKSVLFSEEKQKYKYLILDSELPLKSQLDDNKHIAVVFSYNGASQDSISKTASKFDSKIFGIMPSSMRNVSNNSLPILLNHLEMDVYNKVFVKFEKNEIASLSKVFDAGNREAASGNFNSIMTLNGQNDKILSYFLSGYIESRYGIEELNKITDFLSENQRIYEKQDFLEIPELEKLKVVCDEMLALKKAGLFHSAWDEMSFDDIKNFMESKKAAFVFMDLYSHRQISYGIIKHYSETFFPSGRLANFDTGRSLIVPTVMATCFETPNKVASADCKKIVETFVSLEEQRILARNSGLAPVASSADTQDKQAYNVRLWGASSDYLGLDFGSGFTDPVAKKEFFAALRSYL